VAVVLTLVQTKQIRIYINKTVQTKYSKYKYQYCQNTHTYTHPRITKPTHTHTPTHYKTHTNTNPHITKPTHIHTHTLQKPHIHTPTIYKPTHYKIATLQDTHQMIYSQLGTNLTFLLLSHSDLSLPTHCRCRRLLLHLITLNDTFTLGRTPLDE